MTENANAEAEATGDDDTYNVPNVAALSGRRSGARSAERRTEQRQEMTDEDLAGGGAAVRVASRPHVPESIDEEPEEEPEEGPEAGDKPVTINVSPTVDRRLKAYRNKTGLTNLEIVWEAVEAAEKEGWKTVVATAVPPAKTRRFGVRASQTRYAGVGSNSVYTRMTPEERNELRRLVKVAGVPDRSKLIAISLNWHLPGTADKPA
ncbi:hypothetical protein [Streptomyces sp. A 4/2]|uniref:hypothetical protein n=1 Tax=Streptomyces sp. A 4/2 TaxID=2934314 RepID=UPI0020243527|nr:hypothetical protein [Streptomyces sp. A 4/2]